MEPEFIQYDHHGHTVWVRSALRGQHRAMCLCFACSKFIPGTPNNCQRAQELYQFCVKHNMTTPVFECPEFTEGHNFAIVVANVDANTRVDFVVDPAPPAEPVVIIHDMDRAAQVFAPRKCMRGCCTLPPPLPGAGAT